jgi:hypothetical protein
MSQRPWQKFVRGHSGSNQNHPEHEAFGAWSPPKKKNFLALFFSSDQFANSF